MIGRDLMDLIAQYDLLLEAVGLGAINRVNDALDISFRRLEGELRSLYPQIASQGALTAMQRKLVMVDQLQDLLQVARPEQAPEYERIYQEMLQTASANGGRLADELTTAYDPGYPLQPFANIPVDVVAMQARDGVRRLYRHSEDFRNKASAIIEQGLVMGDGPAKVAKRLRSELGTTKSKAETIARTEISSAFNDAAQTRYANNGIEGVQVFVTPSDALCSVCAARNGKVYETGNIRVPLHPRCRCMLVPWKKSWQEQGYTDDPFVSEFRQKTLDDLEKAGGRVDNGPSPFERMAGAKPPRAIWTPGSRPPTLRSIMNAGQGLNAQLGDDPSLADFENLRRQLLSSGMPIDEAQDRAKATGYSATARQAGLSRANDDIAEFQALAGGNVKQNLGIINAGDRPYADLDNRAINLGKDYSKSQIYHELGHFLEADNPAVAKAAREWRDSKATGPADSLRNITGWEHYDADERALPGNYANPYVGKVYKNGYTEVIAVGMEHFATPEGMRRLREADPDHFEFMLGVIQRGQQQRLGPQGTATAGGEKLFMGWNGYRPLTPVEEAMQRSQQRRADDFAAYLKREEESVLRRTSGAIDRQLREYRDAEAAIMRERLGIKSPTAATKPPADTGLEIKSYDREPTAVKRQRFEVDEDSLNATGKQALQAVRDYEQVIEEINIAVKTLPKDGKSLPADAYERSFEKIDQLFDRLKGTTNTAKSLAGRSGNEALDAELGRLSRISKESLPGYRIQKIDKKTEDRAAMRPC